MSRPGNDKPWMGPLPAAPGCDCHICRPDGFYDEQDRRTIDTVLEHGWQVVVVADDADCSHPDHDEHSSHDHDEPGPAFAYTVGLGHRAGHPELLISGLNRRVMHRALNDVARRVPTGHRLAPGDPIEHTGGLARDPAWSFPVAPDHQVFSCTHVVDDGEAVLWAARESDEVRGEDWSIHCGAFGHETDDIRIVHLAHLVRSAPSLRQISNLGLDEEALRVDTDSPWATARLS